MKSIATKYIIPFGKSVATINDHTNRKVIVNFDNFHVDSTYITTLEKSK